MTTRLLTLRDRLELVEARLDAARRKCSTGYACGSACISLRKECRSQGGAGSRERIQRLEQLARGEIKPRGLGVPKTADAKAMAKKLRAELNEQQSLQLDRLKGRISGTVSRGGKVKGGAKKKKGGTKPASYSRINRGDSEEIKRRLMALGNRDRVREWGPRGSASWNRLANMERTKVRKSGFTSTVMREAYSSGRSVAEVFASRPRFSTRQKARKVWRTGSGWAPRPR